MSEYSKIKQLISNNAWDQLITSYSIKDLCYLLDFRQAMQVAKHLFYDDIQDNEKQQYAFKLTLEIKNHFENEWENDWKNYVFLGGLCTMLCLYDERYTYYKKAYDMLKDPPAALLLRLSGCNSAPGKAPITNEESEFYLKKSIEKELTSETALKMKNLCIRNGDNSQAEYWHKIFEKLNREKIHSDQLIPDVLKS